MLQITAGSNVSPEIDIKDGSGGKVGFGPLVFCVRPQPVNHYIELNSLPAQFTFIFLLSRTDNQLRILL